MEYVLIIARSITYAQRMSVALERAGVTNRIYRAPAGLTERGCAYAVRIREQDLAKELITLHQAQIRPVQIYLFSRGVYQELPER